MKHAVGQQRKGISWLDSKDTSVHASFIMMLRLALTHNLIVFLCQISKNDLAQSPSSAITHQKAY